MIWFVGSDRDSFEEFEGGFCYEWELEEKGLEWEWLPLSFMQKWDKLFLCDDPDEPKRIVLMLTRLVQKGVKAQEG